MQSLAKSLGSLHIDAGAKAGCLFKGQMRKQHFREGGGYHLPPFFWWFLLELNPKRMAQTLQIGTNTYRFKVMT